MTSTVLLWPHLTKADRGCPKFAELRVFQCITVEEKIEGENKRRGRGGQERGAENEGERETRKWREGTRKTKGKGRVKKNGKGEKCKKGKNWEGKGKDLDITTEKWERKQMEKGKEKSKEKVRRWDEERIGKEEEKYVPVHWQIFLFILSVTGIQ